MFQRVHVLSETHEYNRYCLFHPDLDNLVGSRGEQISSGGLIVHVNNAVLAVVEGGCGRSTRRHKRVTPVTLLWEHSRKLRAQRLSI